MKTSIQIPDDLLKGVRHLTHRERTTLKALVEEGLRRIISNRTKRSGFCLRKASFKGNGIQPHLADVSWNQIREFSYKEQGR